MPRNEARIKVDIWRDEDFLALPERAQLLYFFLLSQSELTWAGGISLVPRRWAGTLHRSPEEVTAALEQLAGARFVVIDWETEELLIRSFVRNGGVQQMPNVWKHATTLAERVTSPTLRAALEAELARVPRNPSPNPSAMGSANPSANPSGNPPPLGMSAYSSSSSYSSKGTPPVDNSTPVGRRRRSQGGGDALKARAAALANGNGATPYPLPVAPAARADTAYAFAQAQPPGSLEYDVRRAAQQQWAYDPAMRDAAVGAWLAESEDF